MAANTHATGFGSDTVEFDRPINHILFFVGSSTTCSISLDKGLNFIELNVGFNSFPVGAVTEVHINSTGDWSMVGVQA